MSVTPSYFRANIYKLLDQILKTNKPLEIVRNGETLIISAQLKPKSRNANTKKRTLKFVKREIYKGDPKELGDMNWEHEWTGADFDQG